MVRRRNIFRSVVDAILVLVTILLAVALFFALIARWVNPHTTTIFAFFALAAPLLYLANFVVMCVWIVRWRGWAIVSALVFVFGLGNVGDYLSVDWFKRYDENKKKDRLNILTYNVHNFRSHYFDSQTTMDFVCRKVVELDADLVFLQEYHIADSSELRRFDSLLISYPYRAYQYDVSKMFAYTGQAILSRYPLSASQTVSFQYSENCVLVVDAYLPSDTLRLFGCHLQTTSFNSISHEQGLRSVIDNDKTDSLARTAVAAMSENFRLRSIQADSLAVMIAQSPYGVVVAGDFNSPPLTYTYSTVKGDLTDAFCEAGSGYGYTYKPLKGLFRIDYVLFDSDRYDAASYLSPSVPYSDHNPVFVKLNKRK